MSICFPAFDADTGSPLWSTRSRGPNGRGAGTLTWAGAFNTYYWTYYWIDPEKRVTGVILTQILPFADDRAVRLYGEFERGVYDALQS